MLSQSMAIGYGLKNIRDCDGEQATWISAPCPAAAAGQGAGKPEKFRQGQRYFRLPDWNSTAMTMMAAVNMRRLASSTALSDRILSR